MKPLMLFLVLVVLAAILIGCAAMSNLPDGRQHTINQFDSARTARPESHRSAPAAKAGTWNVLAYQGCCEANTTVTPGPFPALWNIAFPQAGSSYPNCAKTVTCNSLNTIKETYTAVPSHQLSMTFTITTTGSPTFNYLLNSDNTCINNAQMRLFFETKNDDGSAYDRWYSQAGYVIYPTSGQAVFTVPLDGKLWGSVYGESGASGAGAAGFNSALNHLGYVGMVFGGGCFAAHGVSVSNGTAKLTLYAFPVS